MKITHAIWERDNLGTNAYEILLDPADSPEALATEEKRLIAEGAQYLMVKTPVNCPNLLFGLPALGYTFVEMVFHVAIKREDYHMPALIARFDRGLSVAERREETDLERIYGLIRQGIFRSDRVSIDPHFTPKKSGNRYARWLASMVAAGGKVYEMVQGAKPLGFFVICRVDEQTVDPVLMGLYDEQNDRGMGALLHKKTLDTCFGWDCAKLQSTIVSNNAKVLRVYVNAGATITDTLYTYVKHL